MSNIDPEKTVPENYEDAVKKYSVRPGTIDSGKEYEVKMITLLSLRCAGPETQEARLAFNAEVCGDFDDVAMYRMNNQGQKCLHLLQLKHKEKPKPITINEFLSTTKKQDFSLIKYTKSYAELSENNFKKIKDLFGQEVSNDQVELIVYTNRDVGSTNRDVGSTNYRDVEKYDFLVTCEDVDQFLQTGPNSVVKKICKDGVDKLNKNKDKPIDGMFLDRFRLFTNQSHYESMDDLIRLEIQKLVPDVILKKNDAIIRDYLEYVKKWARGELGKATYLLDKNRIINKVTHLVLDSYVVKFKDSYFGNFDLFHQVIENQSIIVIESDKVVTEYLFGYIKHLLKIDNDEAWFKDVTEGAKIFFSSFPALKYEFTEPIPSAIKMYDFYIALWQQNQIPLVVEVKDQEEYLAVIDFLQKYKPGIKTIILTNLSNIETRPELLTNLTQLGDDLKEAIFDCNVSFQGRHNTTLKYLVASIGQDLSELIWIKDIVKIFSDKFVIGFELTKLPVLHIEDRTVSKVSISFDVIKETGDIFLISCDDKNAFKLNFEARFPTNQCLIFDEEHGTILNLFHSNKCVIILCKEGFPKIQLDCAPRNLHYLIHHPDGDWLEWVKTKGTIENISSDRSKIKEQNLGNLLDTFKDNLGIISAEPGMGKSVATNYLASMVPIETCVMKINLREYTHYFSQKGFERNNPHQHLIYFNEELLKAQNQNSFLNQVVFQNLFLDFQRVFILFDGFDEISPTFKSEVAEMILSISQAGYAVCVTTRPIMQGYMERKFNSFAVTLSPFTQNQKIKFFEGYFSGSSDSAKISNFVQEIIVLVERVSQMVNSDFFGVPLHCKILADVLQKDFRNYVQTGSLNLHESFDLLSLYQKFVDDKCDVLVEKFKDGRTNRRALKKYYMWIALKNIFDERDLIDIPIQEKLKKFLDEASIAPEQVGFVTMNEDLNLTFTHRTLSEYFAGRWLYKNVKKKKYPIVCEKLLKKTFKNCTVVRNFFDRHVFKKKSLHNAVMNRRIDKVKDLLEEVGIDDKDMLGRSPLHVIASWGEEHPIPIDEKNSKNFQEITTSIAQLLINVGIKFQSDNLGLYPSDYAIWTNSLEVLNEILAKFEIPKMQNIDINAYLYYSTKYGYLPLMVTTINQNTLFFQNADTYQFLKFSATKFSVELLRYLYEMGMDFNKKDSDGWTVLLYVASFANKATIEYVIDRGADFNARDRDGSTALMLAAKNNKIDILDYLLVKGADINKRNINDFTALHLAVRFGNKDTVEFLVSRGALLNLKTSDGQTVLMMAAQNCKLDVVQFLVANQVNLNEADNLGQTALHFAACYDNKPVVEFLVGRGANYKARTRSGRTPFMFAAKSGQVAVMDYLLEEGESVNVTDYNKCSAWHLAIENGRKSSMKYLLEHKVDTQVKTDTGYTPLMLALQRRNLEIIKFLPPTALNINETNDNNETALHIACCFSNEDIVGYLLEQGASITVKTNAGRSPLMLAARHDRLDIIRYLISKGADVNDRDFDQNTALHMAVIAKSVEAVVYLIEQGAGVKARNSAGLTPFISAAQQGQRGILECLITSGANIDDADLQGRSAWQYAHEAQQHDTVQFLLRRGALRWSEVIPFIGSAINHWQYN